MCLDRKAREGQREIVLTMPDGTLVTITVLRHTDSECRLGITAPKTVKVRRSELPSVVANKEAAEWEAFVKGKE